MSVFALRSAVARRGPFTPRRSLCLCACFFFQAEDGIRDYKVTGVQTCALPISMPLSAWIAASFSRWVVRARPNVPAKSTSQSRGVVVRRASSTSSRRNGREPSTRNAMYRYRGRCVLTLGDGGEMEKGSGKKRRRSAYFVHFGGRLHDPGVHVLAEERFRLDARDHE